ncbi:unnamed protein product [Urochloa humidicola]
MHMHPVSRLAPARPHARVVGTTTTMTCQARATRSRASPRSVAPLPRPRARATSCGGGTTEPVVEAPEVAEEEAVLAPEELDVLEEAAIAVVDEGRRPTDYDRRAHIFEESSRVFQELKHRRDGDGDGGGGAATEVETGTRQQQQLG